MCVTQPNDWFGFLHARQPGISSVWCHHYLMSQFQWTECVLCSWLSTRLRGIRLVRWFSITEASRRSWKYILTLQTHNGLSWYCSVSQLESGGLNQWMHCHGSNSELTLREKGIQAGIPNTAFQRSCPQQNIHPSFQTTNLSVLWGNHMVMK